MISHIYNLWSIYIWRGCEMLCEYQWWNNFMGERSYHRHTPEHRNFLQHFCGSWQLSWNYFPWLRISSLPSLPLSNSLFADWMWYFQVQWFRELWPCGCQPRSQYWYVCWAGIMVSLVRACGMCCQAPVLTMWPPMVTTPLRSVVMGSGDRSWSTRRRPTVSPHNNTVFHQVARGSGGGRWYQLPWEVCTQLQQTTMTMMRSNMMRMRR